MVLPRVTVEEELLSAGYDEDTVLLVPNPSGFSTRVSKQPAAKPTFVAKNDGTKTLALFKHKLATLCSNLLLFICEVLSDLWRSIFKT